MGDEAGMETQYWSGVGFVQAFGRRDFSQASGSLMTAKEYLRAEALGIYQE
jgi:hypothetical protein